MLSKGLDQQLFGGSGRLVLGVEVGQELIVFLL